MTTVTNPNKLLLRSNVGFKQGNNPTDISAVSVEMESTVRARSALKSCIIALFIVVHLFIIFQTVRKDINSFKVTLNGRKVANKGFFNQQNKIIPTTIFDNTSIKNLFQERATKDGYIIVTSSNYGLREQAANFICNMQQLNITNWILGVMDNKMENYSINVLKLTNVLPLKDAMEYLLPFDENIKQSYIANRQLVKQIFFADYSQHASKIKGFRPLLTRLKMFPAFIGLILQYKVIFTDVDIYYLQNPITAMRQLLTDGKYDIMLSTDDVNRSKINSGFLYLNPDNDQVLKIVKAVTFSEDLGNTHQSHMRKLSCRVNEHYECVAYYNHGNKAVLWYYLDPDVYSVGNPRLHFNESRFDTNGTFKFKFVDKNNKSRVFIHSNFCNGEAKINKLKTNGIYLLGADNHTCVV